MWLNQIDIDVLLIIQLLLLWQSHVIIVKHGESTQYVEVSRHGVPHATYEVYKHTLQSSRKVLVERAYRAQFFLIRILTSASKLLIGHFLEPPLIVLKDKKQPCHVSTSGSLHYPLDACAPVFL